MDMKKDSISFSVKMTVKELYRFIMYHAYHKLSGVIGIAMSIAACIILITRYASLTDQTRAVLVLVAIWFVFLDPIILYSRARGQVRRNKAYKKPLHYQIDSEGVTISQEEQSQTVMWNQFMKIVETKNQFLFYSTPMYAFIFPKAELVNEDLEIFPEIIKTYTENTNVQLKGNLKG
ncbi:MAG: YcxB family protein [Eubacteriales bacterium]|nr:YcxB family protein [Eubacteriales bacterium]